MDIERFTLKAQDAIDKACRLAVKSNHKNVTPAHLVSGLLEQSDGPTKKYLHAGGADAGKLASQIRMALTSVPQHPGDSGDTPIDRDLEALLIRADELSNETEDKYVGINHLLLAACENEKTLALFTAAGGDKAKLVTALRSDRGGRYKAGEAGPAEFPNLLKYGNDLTAVAREGKLDPVISRDNEIRTVIQVLSRRTKNNPVIIGEPGVGKTAIVEGLAQRIVRGDVPEDLASHSLVVLDMGSLVAGTKFRGEFEERLKLVIDEVQAAENVLLFIDEIHTLVGAGAQEGSMDAANLLKPALSRGKLRVIGATTLNEYRKRIEKDTALTRRFQIVMADEPTPEATVSIMRGLKEKYEVHHGVRITDAAINAAVRLSHRYVTDRFLPDKAIDLIDQAAATLRMDIFAKPEPIEKVDRKIIQHEIEIKALERETDKVSQERLKQLKTELTSLKAESAKLTEVWQKEKKAILEGQQAKEDLEGAKREMEQKIREQDFARVAELQYKIIPAREKVLAELGDVNITEVRYLRREVIEADVAAAVSKMTGIPVSKMMESERQKLMKMEDSLHRRVVGQNDPVVAISKAIRRSRAGLQDPSRPIASFLMLGPTGVGKTELAKALAEFLFDDERAMVRLDMSEFMEKHTVARLVGAPPGYVGYEEGGVLTNKVKRKPYSVILFDEVEKAHGDVFNVLLQVLDDGRLTDNQNNVISFTNTVIILTSNLGADAIVDLEGNEEGFDAMKENVMVSVRKHFRPEFLNRLDDTVIFRRLSRENVRPIVEIQLNRVRKTLADRRIQLAVDEAALEQLATEGYDPMYGARPLKRLIQRKVQDPLAEAILEGRVADDSTVHVRLKDGAIVVQPTTAAPAAPASDADAKGGSK